MLRVGDKVPDFTISGIRGNGEVGRIKLSDFLGKNIILYFYPADDTKQCTIEACKFRDALNVINKAVVLGVSPNGIDSHRLFHQKHLLNFALLSDENHELAEMFGAWDDVNGSFKRQTFLLNGDGKIIKEWRIVNVDSQVYEIFNDL